jgi:hypothetical protein
MRMAFVGDADDNARPDQIVSRGGAEHGLTGKTDTMQEHTTSVTQQPRAHFIGGLRSNGSTDPIVYFTA